MFEFGDVLYRPCLSYAGKKNFVNTQIITGTEKKNGIEYIRSIDAFTQNWTDNVADVGVKVFTNKEDAAKALIVKMKEKVANSKEDGYICVLCGEPIEREMPKVCDKCASEYKF